MRVRKGKEMRRYLISVTALVVALLLVVIVYTTIDSVRRINREMDKEKTRVVEQLVDYFTTTMQALTATGQDTELMSVFREDLISPTDPAKRLVLLDFLTQMERKQFNADYLVYVSNGNVITKSVAPGLNITTFPSSLPDGNDKNYVILDELGGREGFFISVFAVAPLVGYGEEFMNFSVDRTDQMSALEKEYTDAKSDLITRQIIIGVIILLLGGIISALGVYYLTKRDITGPIEEINRISDQIMEGSFEGEVEVNRDSDFASLQALLSSGKKILDKLDELQE
jgi:hypothetical protein